LKKVLGKKISSKDPKGRKSEKTKSITEKRNQKRAHVVPSRRGS
jgi:hypothetical protein